MADWSPGDLALCVNDKSWGHPKPVLVKHGGIYTVSSVAPCGLCIGLHFENVQLFHGPGHDARRFRKIRPHTPDAEDAETIALLNGQHIPVEV